MKVTVVGLGPVGQVAAAGLANAGHDVLGVDISRQRICALQGGEAPIFEPGLHDLIREAASNAKLRFLHNEDVAEGLGDVVLIAVPYGALPQVGRDYGTHMQGKVVIDCGNPRADRDGPMADDAIEGGPGVASAGYLPGVRLVRAFSAVGFTMVRDAPRSPERIGIPIAGDDSEAVEVTTGLVEDAGFDPVFVGGLDRAREFDRGTAVYVRGMSAAQLREALGLRP